MLLMATWVLVGLLLVPLVLVVIFTLMEFRIARRERRQGLAPLESGSARDAVRKAIERRR
jgi:cytochrome c-type biogenesis protein CcmH/NrfF